MAKDKAADFVRLAEARLPNVINALRIFGHLTNRHAYECTPEQVKHYLDQIDEGVQAIRDGFGVELCPPPTIGPFPGLAEAFKEIGRDETTFVPTPSGIDTDDHDAAARPNIRYVEDPAYTLADWKADPTTLDYRAWVAERHRNDAAAVPDFAKKDFSK